MEPFIKQRKTIRQFVTRIINQLDNIEDRAEGVGKIDLLKKKYDELKQLDEQILQMLLKDESQETIDAEMETAFDYENNYHQAIAKFKIFIEPSNPVSSQINNPQSRKLKLPPLNIEPFSGDIKDWLSFESQILKIDNDPSIDDIDKFRYLEQATIPGSRPHKIVKSYPPCSGNFKKAFDSLKNRFGSKDLLIEYYVRELLKLTLSMSNNSKLKVTTIYDNVETQLRALDTLGVTTSMYAAMLFPLVESCLNEELLRAWQRSLFRTAEPKTIRNASNLSLDSIADVEQDPNGLTKLERLMNFIKNEAEAEERITLAVTSFSPESKRAQKDPQIKTTFSKYQTTDEPSYTVSDLVNVKSVQQLPNCIFCDGKHLSEDCFKARKLSLEEKRKIVTKNKLCWFCLKSAHLGQPCKYFSKCIICEFRHVPIMCPKYVPKTDSNDNVPHSTKELNLSNFMSTNVYLQTLVVRIRSSEIEFKTVRALIDTGSQRSYIRKDLSSELNLQSTGNEKSVHALFGGLNSEECHHSRFKIRLANLSNSFFCNFDVLDQEIICSPLPKAESWLLEKQLAQKNIKVHDRSGPIDLLIGADVVGKLLTGKRVILDCGLVAVETLLGWTVMGKTNCPPQSIATQSIVTMINQNKSIAALWELEILGIEDPIVQKRQNEIVNGTLTHFHETIKVNSERRYEVRMPWVEGHLPLPRNFMLAKRRLQLMIPKLKEKNAVNTYNDVFSEWLNEGIIESVPMSDWDKGHYLPHRPIFKDHGTTKVRPVFDASAREKGNPSLNQCLEKGVNLLELIPPLIVGFRLHKIGVIADIRKAFLQICIADSERDFFRFLWIDKNEQIVIFRHCRVMFGATCSPFHLGAVINYHLDKCLRENSGPLCFETTINILKKSFYVDNCVTSLSNEEHLEKFIEESKAIFSSAKIDLRGWEFTNSSLLENENSLVLGLNWNKKSDTLSVNSSNWSISACKVTKRVILSFAQRIFDPIGFTCPTTLYPKLLLQKLWSSKIPWDNEVDTDTKNDFLTWMGELPTLETICIPRWFVKSSEVVREWSMHIFCDASKDAYGAAIFVRIETKSEVRVALVLAKSRVAPLKTVSIPKLELMAATIAVRLVDSLKSQFTFIPSENFHYYSDSTTVLSWIHVRNYSNIFVSNRVKEILTKSEAKFWSYVPTHSNPADLVSRGCSAKKLAESKWWEGPTWLYESKVYWLQQVPPIYELPVQKEPIIETLVCTATSVPWYCAHYSKFDKIVRLIGWVRRFIHNCRTKNKEKRMTKYLDCTEIELAENNLIKLIQQESFSGANDDTIASLNPFIDQNGYIRVRTSISLRKDQHDFRYPIVLPGKHEAVRRMVMNLHIKSCHIGTQHLLSLLREKYWIIHGRRNVKSVIKQCVVCQRYSVKNITIPSPPLPEARVRDASVFETTGIDFAGPLQVKGHGKVWICLFTCAVYRAVHLELVEGLSSEKFILAFRRFIDRRGKPTIVYSDNGTNFIGTENAFKDLNWDTIAANDSLPRIEWRFNPPSAPWWGGFWERIIGLLKRILRKVLGKAHVRMDELHTILCDCEAVINSRPLTYVTEDTADPIPLTPAMFLLDNQANDTADFDAVEAGSLSKRLKYCQNLKSSLRSRFRNEYLGSLKVLSKKQNYGLQIGQIVLIGSDNTKRVNWPLAVVEEMIPGRDGEKRVVKLKTSNGILFRPIQRIYPLEIQVQELSSTTSREDTSISQDHSPNNTETSRVLHKVMPSSISGISLPEQETQETKTRSGRIVKKPLRLQY